jgi:adenylylsulfate kinase-like enzyme
LKTITLTGGAGTGKTERATALYSEHTSQGLHVLVEDEGQIRNSLPERRMSAADLLIVTRQTGGPLTETTTD